MPDNILRTYLDVAIKKSIGGRKKKKKIKKRKKK